MTKPNSELTTEQIEKNRTYSKERYQRTRERDLARKKRVRDERLTDLYEMNDNKCGDCGTYSDTLGFFDFHHTDPTAKEGSISAMLSSASMERVLKEVEKCVMLCPNCHRMRHIETGHYIKAKES